MRAIARAMSWELWLQARFVFLAPLAYVILATGFFHWFFDPMARPETRIFYIFLTQLLFLMVVAGTQEAPRRSFTLPIATWVLVGLRFVIGMGAIVILYVSAAAVVNVVFGVPWPFWKPAAIFAVSLVCTQSIYWCLFRGRTVQGGAALLLLVPVMLLGMVSTLDHVFLDTFWSSWTGQEVAALGLAGGLAYGLAVWSVARDRRGDGTGWVEIWRWIERAIPRWSRPIGWASPPAALGWFCWRQRGVHMPVTMAGILVLICVVGLSVGIAPPRLLSGMVRGVYIFLMVGSCIFGLIIGSYGRADGAFGELGGFTATLPVRDSQLSAGVLRTIVTSIAATWLVWTVAMAVVWGFLSLTGGAAAASWTGAEWYRDVFPAGPRTGVWSVLLFSASATTLAWTGASLGSCAALTGRAGFIGLLTGVVWTLAACPVFAAKLLPQEAKPPYWSAVMIFAGVLCLATTVWIFVRARRCRVIEPHVVWLSVLGCAALCGFLLPLQATPEGPVVSRVVLTVGLTAVCVLPFAGAPLAVWWNRHR